MLHTTNNMSLFLHDLLFRFVFSAHFPAVFQKFSKGALPPRTPIGGLKAPPSPLLTKISRAAHAQILASLGIYPRSQSLLLKIHLGSAHVFLSKRGKWYSVFKHLHLHCIGLGLLKITFIQPCCLYIKHYVCPLFVSVSKARIIFITVFYVIKLHFRILKITEMLMMLYMI